MPSSSGRGRSRWGRTRPPSMRPTWTTGCRGTTSRSRFSEGCSKFTAGAAFRRGPDGFRAGCRGYFRLLRCAAAEASPSVFIRSLVDVVVEVGADVVSYVSPLRVLRHGDGKSVDAIVAWRHIPGVLRIRLQKAFFYDALKQEPNIPIAIKTTLRGL